MRLIREKKPARTGLPLTRQQVGANNGRVPRKLELKALAGSRLSESVAAGEASHRCASCSAFIATTHHAMHCHANLVPNMQSAQRLFKSHYHCQTFFFNCSKYCYVSIIFLNGRYPARSTSESLKTGSSFFVRRAA